MNRNEERSTRTALTPRHRGSAALATRARTHTAGLSRTQTGVLVDPATFISAYPTPRAHVGVRVSRPVPKPRGSDSTPGISYRFAGVVVLLLVMSGLLLGAQVARANADDVRVMVPSTSLVVEVQPGDSLWVIARRVHPTGDIRGVVADMVAARGTSVVQVGDVVSVPGR